MFRSIINMLFGVIALTCATAAYGQSDQDNVRLELKSRPGNALPVTLPVYVEIATFQPNVEQGIVFTLNIENNSTETVRILDPIDTMGIILKWLITPKKSEFAE